MIDSQLRTLIQDGVPLLRLRKGQKIPLDKNWSNAPVLTPAEYEALATDWLQQDLNIGIRAGHPLNSGGWLVVLDIDVRSNEPMHTAQLNTALIELGLYGINATVQSGRCGGSHHVYMRTHDDSILKKAAWTLGESADNVDVLVAGNKIESKKAWMIDLLCFGKQAVIPPSTHPDTGNAYIWAQDASSIPNIPAQILERVEALATAKIKPTTMLSTAQIPVIQRPPPPETAEEAARVKSALDLLSADDRN